MRNPSLFLIFFIDRLHRCICFRDLSFELAQQLCACPGNVQHDGSNSEQGADDPDEAHAREHQ
jgi:hypothetical protein